MEFTTLTQNQPAIDVTLSKPQKLANGDRDASKTFWFAACFAGHMDLYSNIETVAKYLNNHQVWFTRCAQPMKVVPLAENGYIINVGRFASLGYEVEPKVAVILDPPQDNLYLMRTVPVPDYDSPGYEVQYKALMDLAPIAVDEVVDSRSKLFSKKLNPPSAVTRVSWSLDLMVTVEFPKIIRKLPTNLVQNTGDRLLAQIVRQVSPRLTYKVQQDFHKSHHLPIPPKNGRGLYKVVKESDFAIPSDDDSENVGRSEVSENNDYAA